MIYCGLHDHSVTVRAGEMQQAGNQCWQLGLSLLSCKTDIFLLWAAALLLQTSVSPVALKSVSDILMSLPRPPLFQGVLADPL